MTVLSKHTQNLLRSPRYRAKDWLYGPLLAAAVSCTAHATQANTACALLPPDTTAETALSALRTMGPQCYKDGAFLYELGRLLNQTRQYAEAIDPLEGALLHQPDHWPSQLEYAIALEGTGDHHSALGLLQILQQNPAIDNTIRQQIESLMHKPQPSTKNMQLGTVSLAAGYDSNLLRRTSQSQFVLTTPIGPLPVTLSDDQLPIAGTYLLANASYDIGWASSPNTQWRLSLAGSHRTSANLPIADQGQLGLILVRSAIDARGPYLLAQYQALTRAAAPALRQTQLGLGYDLTAGPNGGCRQRLGLEYQHLAYPQSPEVNGHYAGLVSITNCPPWGLQFQISAGKDQQNQADRPGGAQSQVSARVAKHVYWETTQLALEWEATRTQDHAGYSPLLQDNARRRVSRQAYRLECSWTLNKVNPYISIEWQDQRSNIAMFESKARLLAVGVRASW